jgi:hypothetical protein
MRTGPRETTRFLVVPASVRPACTKKRRRLYLRPLLDACFVVTGNAGQKLACVYFEDEPGRRSAAKFLLTPPLRHRAIVVIAEPWMR